MRSPVETWPRAAAAAERIADAAASLDPGSAATGMVEEFRRHDLLVQASALAFRAFLALIPCVLFCFGLLGVAGLDEVWRDDLAPDLRDSISPAVFEVMDDAINRALTQHAGFWATVGALLAVWEVSGIVRGTGKVLDRIYETRRRRPTRELFTTSIVVGAAVLPLMLIALAAVRLGPLLLDDVWGDGTLAMIAGGLVRWSIAGVLLLVAVGLVVRKAPSRERPLPWVSFGAVLSVGAWILASAAYGLYLTQIADYGSLFGNLATVFVTLEYLFLASVVLLGGLVLDRLVEKRSR